LKRRPPAADAETFYVWLGNATSVGSEVVFVVDSLEGAVDLLVKFIHDPLALPILLVVGIRGQVALEIVHVAVQFVKPNPLL
jgi:hypothetical protein